MFKLQAENPFPALFDNAEKGGYPKSEMGYIRAYYDRRNERWYNTCFPIGEFKKSLAHELDAVYGQFITLFPTTGKMMDFCRKNGFEREDWCGYDQYIGYLETPIALYRLIMRNMSGDYNLYLHCYDRYEIPWSDDTAVFDRAMENYECYEEVLNSAHFDFNVSLPKIKLLRIYATMQNIINGDKVTYPEEGQDEKYTGNYGKFLLSCNGKEGYSRTNEEIDHLEFIM